MIITKQSHKKLGIFGLGKTGIASYEACKISNNSDDIICYDDQQSSREAFKVKNPTAKLVSISDEAWQHLEAIILSPGIALDLPARHPIVHTALTHNIPIISDLEILHEEFPTTIFIGITGTNGKSTTTALITHILNSCHKPYIAGGNIGEAVLSLAEPISGGGYVLELSSFQIDLLNHFHLNVVILLNITADHIDRYGNFNNYMNAKLKIIKFLTAGGTLIIAIDNIHTKQLYHELISVKQPFNIIAVAVNSIIDNGLSITSNNLTTYILDDYFANNNKIKLPPNIYLKGQHNLENILASIAAAKILGCEDEQILSAISSFSGLAHRMQFVACHNNISFYNDSKATNADSAEKSLNALSNIFWLAGGVAKENGINSLTHLMSNINKAYLFGQAAEDFAETLNGIAPYQIFTDLSTAFEQAIKDAEYYQTINPNQLISILLAPACASYDQFKNFEERGNKFIELVQKYTNLKNNID